jgi:hypothetical protein
MELSDDKVLEAVLRMWEADQKSRQRKASEPVYEAPSEKSLRRRCKCGSCPKCQDNARWERIFHEKFEDSEYYELRPLPLTSPLDKL